MNDKTPPTTFTYIKRMGTKLQYATNLLAISPSSSSFSVLCVDELDYLHSRGPYKNLQITTGSPYKFWGSMDVVPDKHTIDYIKRTMQMHEDVFKHQVRELHRLYSVQRMLMDELKREIKESRRYWSTKSSSDINHSQFIKTYNSLTQSTSGYSLNVDPRSRERSGSCSGETMKMTRVLDLERPAADHEDMSTGVSAIDDNQAGPSSYMFQKRKKLSLDGSDDDSEVELTLSIGGSTSRKITKSYQPLHIQQIKFSDSMNQGGKELDSPASFKSERGEDCSVPTTPMSSSSTTLDQERSNQAHWLFQGLSINKTQKRLT